MAVGVLASAPRIAAGQPCSLAQRLAPLRDRSVLRLLAVTFVAASGGLMFYTLAGDGAERGPLCHPDLRRPCQVTCDRQLDRG